MAQTTFHEILQSYLLLPCWARKLYWGSWKRVWSTKANEDGSLFITGNFCSFLAACSLTATCKQNTEHRVGLCKSLPLARVCIMWAASVLCILASLHLYRLLFFKISAGLCLPCTCFLYLTSPLLRLPVLLLLPTLQPFSSAAMLALWTLIL